MGRPSPLQRIKEEKSRLLTFHRRSMGLCKKAQELSILCGIDTCVIIYPHSSDARHSKPLFWPPDPDHLRSILRRYKQHHAKAKTLKKFNEERVSQTMGRQDEGPVTQNPNFTDNATPASTQVLKVPHLSAAPAVDCSPMDPHFLSASGYFFGGPSDCNTLCSPPSPQPQFLCDPVSGMLEDNSEIDSDPDAVASMLLSPLPPQLQFFHEPSSGMLETSVVYSNSDAEAASSSATLPPPPQDQFFYEQPCSGMPENMNIVYPNAGGVASSSSSSWPAMPPYNDYCYPEQYSMAGAPIQSLPLQMNTDGNETWEQYLIFD